MKTFRYRHSIVVWIILSVVLLITGAGVGLNIISATEEGIVPFKIISYAVLGAINLFLFALVLSAIIKSEYLIKNGLLVMRFGFISIKTPLDELICITKITYLNKLVLNFKGGKYSVIVISPDKFDDFVGYIKSVCPDVEYMVKSDDTENVE